MNRQQISAARLVRIIEAWEEDFGYDEMRFRLHRLPLVADLDWRAEQIYQTMMIAY